MLNLRVQQCRFLLKEDRTFEQRMEVRAILNAIEMDRNRFVKKFPQITSKTKAPLLVNQLNYIRIVVENNLVYLQTEDDFIYKNHAWTCMDRLEREA